MVDPNPEARPDAETCLQHRWFHSDAKLVLDMLVLNKVSTYQAIEVKDQQVEGSALFGTFMLAPNYF